MGIVELMQERVQSLQNELKDSIIQTQNWQLKTVSINAKIEILKEMLSKEGETNGIRQEIKEGI